MSSGRPPRHPVLLVPGGPGDGAAPGSSSLPRDLEWVLSGADPVAEAAGLLREMGADASALSGLTGFAGLERQLVWAKARVVARERPAGVRIGTTADRQLSWLRRVQGPGQLADMVDLVDPRVDRHRAMPDVFGDRARRARLLESLWEWGRSWQDRVAGGGVRLHLDHAVEPRVHSVASWIGVPVEGRGAGPSQSSAPTLTLANLGPDGDGGGCFRVRIHAPLHLAVDGGQGFLLDDALVSADDPDFGVSVGVSARGIVVQVAGFSRWFGAPAILECCERERVTVAPPDSWVNGWGDILVWFRADPARMP